MFKRILLFLVVLASIIWLGFVASDILSDKNKYEPKQLFGHRDGELLLITRPSEFSIHELSSFANSVNFELISDLNSEKFDVAYISKERPHALFIRRKGWDSRLIKELSHNFKQYGYQFRFNKTKLYFWKGEIEIGQGVEELKYDKKASATVMRFDEQEKLIAYTDIYFKDEGLINFVTRDHALMNGKQVDDASIFAAFIPASVDNYHFYERDFYASDDTIFQKGAMFSWIQNGYLDLEFNGERVLVSDYIDGQDPILVLQDLSQIYDTASFKIPLTNTFPEKGKAYHLKYLEDLVVISSNPNTCEQFIAAYKLGQTIALNEQAMKKHFGTLPKKVSERHIMKEKQISRSVYKGKLLETFTGQKALASEKSKTTSKNIACNFPVSDFVVFSGNGNLVALGGNGEVAGFQNGKRIWNDQISGEPLGSMQHIDLHGNGEDFVLVNTKDKIHLWSANGDKVTGFPIDLEKDAVNEVKFYRWKGSSYFLIASTNEVSHFDAKGRELNIIRTPFEITEQIDVWVSQKKLFAGFRSDKQFTMYDIDSRRMHREFELLLSTTSLKIPNELVQFGFTENQLVKVNQKGIRTNYGAYPDGKIVKSVNSYNNPMFVVQSGKYLSLHNSDGTPFAKLELIFDEISDVDIHINDSGKTYIAVIDGLENNVYLYGVDGRMLLNHPLEGQTKVVIRSNQSGKLITTIVDEYVIQYFEN